ncbi:MAG: Rpn family recombination-promoting nuclease/putative transposase [Holosporaceae bacterium]|nr:Rpn family recombination-promoting nuclease/putative transposase [Holosporaceae bacterium]
MRIRILEESLFKDKRFLHIYHMREDENHELLSDDEEIHFLELRKMKKFREDSPDLVAGVYKESSL